MVEEAQKKYKKNTVTVSLKKARKMLFKQTQPDTREKKES